MHERYLRDNFVISVHRCSRVYDKSWRWMSTNKSCLIHRAIAQIAWESGQIQTTRPNNLRITLHLLRKVFNRKDRSANAEGRRVKQMALCRLSETRVPARTHRLIIVNRV